MNRKETKKTWGDDLRVTIPTDKYPDKKKPSVPRTIIIGEKDLLRLTPKGFRWVKNLWVFYKDDEDKEEVISDLQKYPMKIRVGHKKDDGKTLYRLDKGSTKPKKIGVFIKDTSAVGYDGYGEATITKWGDPNIGWG